MIKLFEYLWPENEIARWVVYASLVSFGLWLVLLLYSLIRHLQYRRHLARCEDVTALTENEATSLSKPAEQMRQEAENVFHSFLQTKRITRRSPIAKHLWAIFEAGRNESQLDIRSLIKNTTDAFLHTYGLQRSLLAMFIILGLLGTLFGLADTLAALDALLGNTTRLDNEVLGQSLKEVLGTLKSSFAPSILGVFLTIIGVLLLSFYVRFIALPLVSKLERQTLVHWVPQLIPTTSQKLLTKLQLTERQMQRSFSAAQKVAEFAEGIQEKTGDFSETMGTANVSLRQLSQVSANLSAFSQTFIEAVNSLKPFHQDLKGLYQQVADQSKTFQTAVESSTNESKVLRGQIHLQLQGQHQQLAEMLVGLKSYEGAYLASRKGIDNKLGDVLIEAQRAFESLKQRNQELGAALDEELGKPLRESLGRNLNGIQTELQTQLSEVKDSLQKELSALASRMERLDQPLNSAARNFESTFSNFNATTRELLQQLRLEFGKQNDSNQQQLQRLEILSDNLPNLLQTVSESSKNFSGTSSTFAAHGQQLSTDVATLGKNISGLSESVDSLKDEVMLKKLILNVEETERRIADLIGRQTSMLQQLDRTIETLKAAPVRRWEPPVVPPDGGPVHAIPVEPDDGWFHRVKEFFRFGR